MGSLNRQQQAAVAHGAHLRLTSCPGSGKTRVIVAKLVALLADVVETPRRIGCITHTNAAVHEIEERLRERTQAREERSFDVSTIHSFCLLNVLVPFRYVLPNFRDGFEIVTSETDWLRDQVRELNVQFGTRRATAESWANVSRGCDGAPRVPENLTLDATAHLLQELDASSRMTMGDILYHSYALVLAHPFIGRSIASKYVCLLIDEFQDTSDTQLEMFRVIATYKRTNFFIVGDPHQSIYSFTGARPGLMEDFGNSIGAWAADLSGNYRSSAAIVEVAERLIPREPPMDAVGPDRDFPFKPRHHHAETPLDAIWEDFLPIIDSLEIPVGRAAVLSAQWIPLLHLSRALRDRGVPVIGPGARPYRRTLEFAAFAEQACAFVEDRTARAANRSLRALFLMLQQVTGLPDFRVYSLEGKRTLYRLLHASTAIRAQHEGAIPFLVALSDVVASLLHREGWLTEDQAEQVAASGQVMVRSIETTLGNDAMNLAVADLSLFVQPGKCLELMTIHGAKGREFDAVAVIGLHERVLPNWRAQADDDAMEEARRLLYVAATRARKVLCFYTDGSGDAPSRFLGQEGLGLM
jgi:DNA helicase-2/ATP-dependent DNA helicase PcrA